jgi:RecA-family ATPase
MSVTTGDDYWRDLTTGEPLVDWLLPGFLPRGALFALAGMAGTGKSVLSYTIGLALAAGIPVLGMKPAHPYRVLYFDDENSRADRLQYMQWAWRGLGVPPRTPLADNFVSASFELGGPDWTDVAERLVLDVQPDLIVIDTTTPCCAIEDENSNGEATTAVQAIRRLQERVSPTAACLALKHARPLRDDRGGFSGTYTLRGGKAWEGAVDGVLFVIRKEGRPRADGLSNVRIQPAKTRAFGLREPLYIEAKWVGPKDRRGLQLTRVMLRPAVPDEPSNDVGAE